MPNERNIVRNALTKQWIFTALMELMKRDNLNSISITDVCKKAGVSRMAFYRNYEIIEDVIMEHIDNVFNDYFEQIFSNKEFSNYDVTILFFKCFRQQEILICNLVNSKVTNILLKKCNKYLHDLSKKMVNEKSYDTVKENYVIKFVVGGFFNILIDWTLNGMTESDQYMADILYEFCE